MLLYDEQKQANADRLAELDDLKTDALLTWDVALRRAEEQGKRLGPIRTAKAESRGLWQEAIEYSQGGYVKSAAEKLDEAIELAKALRGEHGLETEALAKVAQIIPENLLGEDPADIRKARVLAEREDLDLEEMENEDGGTRWSCGRYEFLVLDEEEREKAIDSAMDRFIEESILCQIPEEFREYFDRAAWKKDAEQGGSLGEHLASYDGHETEVRDSEGRFLYIYRTS